MSDMVFQSASRMAAMVQAREISPVELVEEHIRRIEAVNPKTNAYVTTVFDRAREEARSAEQAISRRNPVGPLHGVPISIKDTVETAGIRTVAGTLLCENYVPERDATVVERLRKAGAIILGKTNVPEFAMDYRSENPVFGRTNNPWDLDRVPGGSSGGEAAAIATGCSAAGVGSDLGGSIRVPSHFCGIAGLKPTPGRIPASGHFPPNIGPFALGASLGPMARFVEDLKLLFGVLAGFDPLDPASVPLPPPRFDATSIRGLRAMWYADDGIAPVTSATAATVRSAASALADNGFEVIERRPEKIERAFDLWHAWLGQGGTPGILKMYEGREELMGPLIKGLQRNADKSDLDLAQFLSAWFHRDGLRVSVVTEMSDYPIILAPVVAVPAFKHDHRNGFDIEGTKVDYLKAFSYSQTYNVLGLPSAVVRCGQSPEGLPIGVQVVGRPYEEETVLAVAAVLERALGGYQRPQI